MTLDPLAGKPAPKQCLADIPALVSAYYELRPDPAMDAQHIRFGTSGHRGRALNKSFNWDHFLTQSAGGWRL